MFIAHYYFWLKVVNRYYGQKYSTYLQAYTNQFALSITQ